MENQRVILRCPECRTRRLDPHLMVLHRLKCKRSTCTCGGYHYKHRPGSPCCDRHPLAVLHRARREGLPKEMLDGLWLELLAEQAWASEKSADAECPF